MCSPHWRKVPKELQKAVWANYVPGQEVLKRPTPEYVKVARMAIAAVAEKEKWQCRSQDSPVVSGPGEPGGVGPTSIRSPACSVGLGQG